MENKEQINQVADKIVEEVAKTDFENAVDELVKLNMDPEQARAIVLEIESQINELKEVEALRDEEQKKMIKNLQLEASMAKADAGAARYETKNLETIVKKHWFKTKMMAATTWLLMVLSGAGLYMATQSGQRGEAKKLESPMKVEDTIKTPPPKPKDIHKDILLAETAVKPAKPKPAKPKPETLKAKENIDESKVETKEKLFISAKALRNRYNDMWNRLFEMWFIRSDDNLVNDKGGKQSYKAREGFDFGEINVEFESLRASIETDRDVLMERTKNFIRNDKNSNSDRQEAAKLVTVLAYTRNKFDWGIYQSSSGAATFTKEQTWSLCYILNYLRGY